MDAEKLPVTDAQCRSCGTAMEPGDRFCANCGAERRAAAVQSTGTVICATCGVPNNATAKFCIKCGNQIGSQFGPGQVWRVPESARWHWRPIHFILIALVGILYIVVFEIPTWLDLKDDIENLVDRTPTPIVRPTKTPDDVLLGQRFPAFLDTKEGPLPPGNGPIEKPRAMFSQIGG
jgi:hypothetical protein